MRLFATAVLALGVLLAWGAPEAAAQETSQEKRAQTGMKFLTVSADPRAAAMGSAMTAMEGGSSMLFYNPAGMARLETTGDLMLGQTQWIADISYQFGSLAFRPAGGRYGVVGVSATFVDYGDFQETIFANNEQGYIDLGTFSPSAWSFGLGYANAVTDRFAVGGQVKYVGQNLGESVVGVLAENDYERNAAQAEVLAFDFGMIYNTVLDGLNFAVGVRNFSREIAFAEEDFELPLTLRIGVALDVMRVYPFGRPGMHSLLVGVEAENPRDYTEQVRLGGEYTFMNTLALRAGYVFPTDEEGFNLGFGLRQEFAGLRFGADYAYTSFGVFSDVHRIGLRLSF